VAISVSGPKTFPVWATVGQAFQLTGANWRNAAKVLWVWVPLIFGLGIAHAMNIPTEGEAPTVAFATSFLVFFLFSAVGFGSIAVAWHRLILLGEQPPWINLGIGGQVPRYVGRALLASFGAAGAMMVCFMLIVLAANALPHIVPGSNPTSDTTVQLIYAILFLFMTLVVGRLLIALPGTAVGNPTSFRRAWEVTKGNSWRLLGGIALIYGPMYLLASLTNLAIARWALDATAALVLLAINQCVGFLCAIVALSYLSLSYRFFMSESAAS
jgi:hypothetical protein